jgi:hypothetical protein
MLLTAGVRSFMNPKNWSIKVKVSLTLLIAALIPAIIVAGINLIGHLVNVQKIENRNLELMASETANRLNQLMLDNGFAASQLASDTEILALASAPDKASEALKASVSSSFTRLLATNSHCEFVSLLDGKGNVIISKQSASLPTIDGKFFSNQPFFTEAMKGISNIDLSVEAGSKKLGLYFSSPVFTANEQIVGVTIIKLQGSVITDIVNNLRVGTNGFAFLVDQDGIVLSSPEPGWNYHSLAPLERTVELEVGQRYMVDGCDNAQELVACKVDSLNLPTLASVIKTGIDPRNAEYKSPINGKDQIVGIASIKPLNWSVVVSQARQEIITPVNILALLSLISILVSGILAILTGILSARGFKQSLDKLAFAAESIEKGGTFQPERLTRILEQGDEIGKVARAFKAMSDEFIARVTELRTVNRVSRKISSSVDISNILTLVLNSIRNVVPYDRASVLLYNPQTEEFSIRAFSDESGHHVLNADSKPVILRRNAGHLSRFFRARNDATSVTMLMPNVRPIPENDAIFTMEWGNFDIKSYLGVPLPSGDQIIGAIEVASAQSGKFSTDHERVLELIAAQAAIAVQNALDVEKRESELRKQIDELKIVIDETKKQKYVSEIVGSDFFQALTDKARIIREQRGRRSSTENT